MERVPDDDPQRHDSATRVLLVLALVASLVGIGAMWLDFYSPEAGTFAGSGWHGLGLAQGLVYGIGPFVLAGVCAVVALLLPRHTLWVAGTIMGIGAATAAGGLGTLVAHDQVRFSGVGYWVRAVTAGVLTLIGIGLILLASARRTDTNGTDR